jgi:hypothetical protein
VHDWGYDENKRLNNQAEIQDRYLPDLPLFRHLHYQGCTLLPDTKG